MERGRHAKRRFRGAVVVVTVAAAIVLLSVAGAAYAAYRYDRATADRILPGVTVGGIDVGGMTRSQAIDAVEGAAAGRLDAPIQVLAADRAWTITPRQLGQGADVETAVDEALDATSSVGFLSRVWHRWRHEPVDVDVALTFDGGSVSSLVDRVADEVAVAPVDAEVLFEDGEVTFHHSRRGQALGRNLATQRLLAALDEVASTVRLPVHGLRPKIPDARLGKTIVVDRSINELYLYDGFDLVHHYPVATAAAGYVTPSGQWTIVNKAENPTWYNPAPDTWGADLPMSIPPGPGNPLGTRALYLDAPGIRIHGTYDVNSIGTDASHGCIRMYMSDVEALYPQVPIGTRVFVV
ncbi:MAG TPA: L,D-transpeptidase family protein [Actinomycetota bacterium]|jgi:lipoprotein-anchoring transpeptidase ErfK/SrfK